MSGRSANVSDRPSAVRAGGTSGRDAREDLTARPLAARDRATRAAIAEVRGAFDSAAMTELWEAALTAPGWDRPSVWFHGGFPRATADRRRLPERGHRLRRARDRRPRPRSDHRLHTVVRRAAGCLPRHARCGTTPPGPAGRGWAMATALNAHVSYAGVTPRIAAQTTRQIIESLVG